MYSSASVPNVTVGLDVGDKLSEVCEINAAGEITVRCAICTSRSGIVGYFGKHEVSRVVLEAGTHSPWLERLLKELGHEVVVANPSKMFVKGRRKSDLHDAEFLARMGRMDVHLLWPIRHRSIQVQQDLEMIRARDSLVRVRSKLICHVRGAVKSFGGRVSSCSAEAFARAARAQVPEELRSAIGPMLKPITQLTLEIARYDKRLAQIAERYPATQFLRQIPGVGPVTSLHFVLLIEDPARFSDSSDAGAFFGLVPKLFESGGSKPQLRISKAGDELGRSHLVSAAHYILGHHGPECDLRRYGQTIAARGGKNAKKRAVVAVARKLAVLMHRLWVSGATYDPDRQLKQRAA